MPVYRTLRIDNEIIEQMPKIGKVLGYGVLLALTLALMLARSSAKRPDSTPHILPSSSVPVMQPELPQLNTPEIARSEPLLIAPMIEGLGTDDENVEAKIRTLLDELEPGGASGDVQIGFTGVVQVFSLYKKINSGWVFDRAPLDRMLNLAKSLRRPVVIYLAANHFGPHIGESSPIYDDLLAEPRNLMTYAGGAIPQERYFQTRVVPLTLSDDEKLPINRLRFKAIEHAARILREFDQSQPGVIAGVALLGEIHHMFPDFSSGMGTFKNIRFTDYSAQAIKEFRKWLQTHYANLQDLNKVARTSFLDWNEVTPPDKDIRHEKLRSYWQHIDAYANGKVPIFGWAFSFSGVRAVEVFINGELAGRAELGINRMDVYEALDEVHNPNLGFRYDLDYSQLRRGIYTLEIVLTTGSNHKVLIDRRDICVSDRNQRTPQWQPRKPLPTDVAEVGQQRKYGVRSWTDHPNHLQALFFNPYARLWQQFREYQVERLIAKSWSIVVNAGFDRKRVFSHQLLPSLNGSWNDMLLAAQASVSSHCHIYLV